MQFLKKISLSKKARGLLSWFGIILFSLALFFLDFVPARSGVVREESGEKPLAEVVVTRSLVRVIPQRAGENEVLLSKQEVKTNRRGRYSFPMRVFLRIPLMSSVREYDTFKKTGYIKSSSGVPIGENGEKRNKNETVMREVILRGKGLVAPGNLIQAEPVYDENESTEER